MVERPRMTEVHRKVTDARTEENNGRWERETEASQATEAVEDADIK
jgi:hypothetical protein